MLWLSATTVDPQIVIENLHLLNFKGFEEFRIGFSSTSVLVGPNNAGKSTCIEALRGVAAMIAHARRLKPDWGYSVDRDVQVRAYTFSAGDLPIEEENLRFEFTPNETRLECHLADGLGVIAVWPAEDEGGGRGSFFYLIAKDRPQPRSPVEVRPLFQPIGVVPQLAPIEHAEELLSHDYLTKTMASRLASRHFRNHLWEMKLEPVEGGRTAFDDFREFAAEWLPEVELVDVAVRSGGRGAELDVFYREGRSRKELVWAGDGVQVFLQILWHVHRLRTSPTIILDEPDVYLHADLQARVTRLLETYDVQVILATHSAEIVAEATPASVLLVDRGTRRAVRSPGGKALEDLSGAIGSHFNLRLARVLRSRVAVFVEGQDSKLLRSLARTVGADAFVNEGPLTVVPLDGVANRARLSGFKWVVDNLLEHAIAGWIILDRDYRSAEEAESLTAELEGAGLRAHIWRLHEIESYLLHPQAVARRSGASPDWVGRALDSAASDMRDEVLPDFLAARQAEIRNRGRAPKTVMAEALREFDHAWENGAARAALCPGKELLSRLNQLLQEGGHRAVTPSGLARDLRHDEIDSEVRELLARINRAARN